MRIQDNFGQLLKIFVSHYESWIWAELHLFISAEDEVVS